MRLLAGLLLVASEAEEAAAAEEEGCGLMCMSWPLTRTGRWPIHIAVCEARGEGGGE